MRRVLLAVVIGAIGFSASAASVSASNFNAFMSLVQGTTNHTIGMGSNGTPLVTQGLSGSGMAARTTGNMTFANTAGGRPYVTGTATLPSPIAGRSVPVVVKQPVKNFGLALGKLLGKQYLSTAFTIASIAALVLESGYQGEIDAQGNVDLYKVTEGSSTEYRVAIGNFGQAWAGDRNAAIASYCAVRGATGCHWAYVQGGTVIRTSVFPGFVGGLELGTTTGGQYGSFGSYQEATQQTPTTGRVDYTHEQWLTDLESRTGFPADSAINRALKDAMAEPGATLETDGAAVATPQGSSVSASPVTNTSSDGSTSTSTQTCDLIAVGGALEWRCGTSTVTTSVPKTVTQTVVTTNPDGTTSTSTVTSTTPGGTSSQVVSGTDPAVIPCGLPGSPPCKIDETGTVTTATMVINADPINTDASVKRDVISGTADKPGFGPSWSGLWSAPPVAACVPITMPPMMGMAIPIMDPCPIVSDARNVFAFLWAFVALWACVGMVRECF